MHLFLGQSFDLISGTKGEERREILSKENLLLDHVQNQRRRTPMVNHVTPTQGVGAEPEQNKGDVLSYLLKGEPPDVPNITKPKAYQGKTLNSQRRMKANLLSLGAGYTVSRSKLFQEREYDVNIKSSSAQHLGVMRLGEGSMKLRRDKETYEKSSAQMEANTNPLDSTTTWRTQSAHLEFTSKKNQFKKSSYEEDIEDTTWQIFNEPAGDIRPLINSFQPNDDESSNKPRCFGNVTHQRTEENWIHPKFLYGLEVIQFANRVNSKLPDLDQRALIGGLRLNQE